MSKIEVEVRTVGTLGKSDTATLQSAFPASPSLPHGYRGQYDNKAVLAAMNTLHDGVVGGNPAVAPGNNPDFPNFSLDYAGRGSDTPPTAGDIKTGAAGLPWTAWSPNVASPGPGSTNPRDLPAPPPGTPADSLAGSTELPGDTTTAIATQHVGGGVDASNIGPGKSGAI